MRKALALALLAATAQAGTPKAESDRIDALLKAIGSLEGAVFLGNGKEHTPGEAVDHLRIMLKEAGDKVRTAEDFIRLCGTGSSTSESQKAYVLRMPDGKEVPCADFLRTELAKLQAPQMAPKDDNPFRKTFQSPEEAMKAMQAREPSAPGKGDAAPDFELKAPDGKRAVRLSDFKGKAPVILLFGSYT